MPAQNEELISNASTIVSEDHDAGMRLDRFLAARIETLSRARLQDLIREGHVTALGKPVKDPSVKIRGGDCFEVTVPAPRPYQALGEVIPLNIVFEDDSLIVIDKPAGLVVHPGAGNAAGTLVNALIAHCGESLSGIGGVTRPGIVHRLDKDTSGLMVVAKSDAAHRGLAAQFADHGRTGDLRREYLALVWGEPHPRSGRIETQTARHSALRTKMAVVSSGGKLSITNYETELTYNFHFAGQIDKPQRRGGRLAVSLVRCRLETGRTHQVRVHMAHIGTPLIGDSLYGAGFRTKTDAVPGPVGGAIALMNRQALHAAVLRFRHPVKGKLCSFESTPPLDIANLCNALEGFTTNVSKN